MKLPIDSETLLVLIEIRSNHLRSKTRACVPLMTGELQRLIRIFTTCMTLAFVTILMLMQPLPALAVEPRTEQGNATFQESLIRGGYGYAYGIAAVDLDMDGDLDIVSSDTTDDKTPEKVNGTLLWYENLGAGKFVERTIAKGENGWFERMAAGDIDGDGWPDVAVVLNRAGGVAWFRNPGKRVTGSWSRHAIVTEKLPGAYDVALGDFDGDGRLDAVASSWTRGNRFVSFRNPGPAGLGADWQAQVIDENQPETRTVRVADIDADGRPDILGTTSRGNLLAWYGNTGEPGKPPAWKKHIISTAAAPIHGQVVDMDGDGDLDVVMAHGMRADLAEAFKHEIAWYENVGKAGKGQHWLRHIVGPLPGAFEAAAADLDGDGRKDIVATAWGLPGRVAWFRNTGAAGGNWPIEILKDRWPNANSVITADLDGDGRPEIVATAERGANELRWWKSLANR